MACPQRGSRPWREFGTTKSVSRVLLEQRVGLELRLRDRHQDLIRRNRAGFVAIQRWAAAKPRLSVLVHANQIRSALALGDELEEAFAEDRVPQSRLGQRRRKGLGCRRECPRARRRID